MNELDIRTLKKLGELKSRGVLSESEFLGLKKWVLDRENIESLPVKEDAPVYTQAMLIAVLKLALQLRTDHETETTKRAWKLDRDPPFPRYQDPSGSIGMSGTQRDAVNNALHELGVLEIMVGARGQWLYVKMSAKEISTIINQTEKSLDEVGPITGLTH